MHDRVRCAVYIFRVEVDGVRCQCGGEYKVIDTRGESEIYRRRRCKRCGRMVCTVEKKIDYLKGVDFINAEYHKIRRKRANN